MLIHRYKDAIINYKTSLKSKSDKINLILLKNCDHYLSQDSDHKFITNKLNNLIKIIILLIINDNYIINKLILIKDDFNINKKL